MNKWQDSTPDEAVQFELMQLEAEMMALQAEVAVATEVAVAKNLTLSVSEENPKQELWTFSFRYSRFTYVNPLVERLFGMSVGQALSAGPDQTSNPKAYRTVCASFQTLYSSSAPHPSKPRCALTGEGMEVLVRNSSMGAAPVPAEYIIVAAGGYTNNFPVEISGLVGSVNDIEPVDVELKNQVDEWGRIFQALPVACFVTANNFTVLRANPAMGQCIACAPAVCEGNLCYKLAHADGTRPDECPMLRSMKSSEITEALIVEPNFGGYYLFNTGLLTGVEGGVVGGICMATDVTELTRMDEMLRHDLVDLDLMQQTCGFGLWEMIIDKGAEIDPKLPVWYSSGVMSIIGCDYEDYPAELGTWSKIMNATDYDRFLECLKSLINGEDVQKSLFFRCVDGYNTENILRWFFMNIRMSSYENTRDSNGSVKYRFSGVLHEVTDEREQVTRQHDIDLKMKQVLSVLNAGIWSVTLEPGKPMLPDTPFDLSPELIEILTVERTKDFDGTYGKWIKILHPDDAQLATASMIDFALGRVKSLAMDCRLLTHTDDEQGYTLKMRGHACNLGDSNKIKLLGIAFLEKTESEPESLSLPDITMTPDVTEEAKAEPLAPNQTTMAASPAHIVPPVQQMREVAASSAPAIPAAPAPAAPVETVPPVAVPDPVAPKAEDIPAIGGVQTVHKHLTEGMRALVIDNDAVDRMLMHKSLMQLGQEVTQLDSGEFVLQEIERVKPDYIISELIMPGATGEAIYKLVRARVSKTIPMIIASQTRLRFKSGKDDPMLAFVTKPCDGKLLAATLETLFRRN